jgi:hypothetical protein
MLGGVLAALVVAAAGLAFARSGPGPLASYAACLIVMYAVFIAMRSATTLNPGLDFTGRIVPGIAASAIGAAFTGCARYLASRHSAGDALGPALALAGTVGFFGIMTALFRLWRSPPRRQSRLR